MTAAQCHRSAAKTRPPDATQKKPDSGNHFPTSDYAKLSLAGEADAPRAMRSIVPRAAGEGSFLWGIVPRQPTASVNAEGKEVGYALQLRFAHLQGYPTLHTVIWSRRSISAAAALLLRDPGRQ